MSWSKSHPDDLFWSKIRKPDGESGCWEYAGCLNASGYGALLRRNILGKKKVPMLAHRYAYTFLVGPIPDDLEIDHLCRNRKCCNPKHLETVTSRQNTLRGVLGKGVRGCCTKGHPRNRHNMRCWLDKDGLIIVICKDCEVEYREANREKIKSYLKGYHKEYYKKRKLQEVKS